MNSARSSHSEKKEIFRFILSYTFLSITCLIFFWLNPNVSEARSYYIEINDDFALNRLYIDMMLIIASHALLSFYYFLDKIFKILIYAVSIAISIHLSQTYTPLEVTIHEENGYLVGLDTKKEGISIIKGNTDNLQIIDIPKDIDIKENRELNVTENQTFKYYWREHDGVIIPIKYRSTPYYAELNLHK